MSDKVATLTLTDGRTVKLGRIRPVVRRPSLRLANYLSLARLAGALPASVDYFTKASESMKRVYLNDQYGDCVIASKYHAVGAWSAADTPQCIVGTDDEVYQQYQTICGRGDNGCIISDVLDYWIAKGMPFNGQTHKIDGYVAVDNRNEELVKAAIYLFGTLAVGINLPGDWTCTDCTWDVSHARIVGGHDVCAVGYDQTGVKCATWGGIVTITWAAFTRTDWIEELWCPLSPDWYNADNLSPLGVDVSTLKADLDKLKGGNMPPLPDPQPPQPPQPPVPSIWQLIVEFLMQNLPVLLPILIALLKALLGMAEKAQADRQHKPTA